MTGLLVVPHVATSEHLAAVDHGLVGCEDRWDTRYVDLDQGDPQAYWKGMQEWWAECGRDRRDLMIVEHDIVTRPDIWPVLDDCTDTVCAYTYWIAHSYRYGLGCTRFRWQLIVRRPDAVHAAGHQIRKYNQVMPVGDWHRLDVSMWEILGQPCVHAPPVRHLHDYPEPDPMGEQ